MKKVDFINISTGTYLIGIDEKDAKNIYSEIFDPKIKKEYLYNSCPRHNCEIQEISFSPTLVTVAEFEIFVNDTGYITEAEAEGWGWIFENDWQKRDDVTWKTPFGNSCDKIYYNMATIFPVIQISWNDANEYCKWMSEKNKSKYRLPYEREWEVFSVLMGGSSIFEIDMRLNNMISKSREFLEAIVDRIESNNCKHPVGLFWEWTMDWFDAYPHGKKNNEFGQIYKVLRGGSLLSHPVQRSREFRFRRCPTARSPFYGFRIVKE